MLHDIEGRAGIHIVRIDLKTSVVEGIEMHQIADDALFCIMIASSGWSIS